jgi:hypothetical protein
MITRQISLTLDVIQNNFKLDKDLIDMYHIESGKGYEICSLRTYNDLKDKTDPSFKFYGVYKEDELIGFFGTELGYYVNTIFVKPEYRNKETMSNFYKCLTDIAGDTFVTALYSKNTRAIDFYLRNNGNIVAEIDNFVVIKIGE